MYRFIVMVLVATLFSPVILQAGSAGVKNGTITGIIYGESGPLGEVYVVATRNEDPPIIRSTISRPDGTYTFTNMPLGSYTIGYSRIGYKPITTEEGDTQNQSAIGEQVRTFIESGSTAMIPDTYMTKLPGGEGPSTVGLTLVDAVTGEPIENATLLVGPEVAQDSGNGNYNTQVNAEYDEDGNLKEQRIVVTADGYEENEQTIIIPGGESTNQTIAVMPQMAKLSGVVQLDPSLDPADYTNVQVIIPNVPSEFSQGQVLNGTGLYEVSVPASTSNKIKTYTIQFLLNNHQMATVSNVVAPRAGSTYVKTPVTIQANTSPTSGNVALSNGAVPSADAINSAVIVELGRSINLSNGSFTFSDVPVGRELTIQVSVRNPDTGAIETGTATFTATQSDGSFNLPTIVTTPATSQ